MIKTFYFMLKAFFVLKKFIFIKLFFYLTIKSGQKWKYLKNENSF